MVRFLRPRRRDQPPRRHQARPSLAGPSLRGPRGRDQDPRPRDRPPHRRGRPRARRGSPFSVSANPIEDGATLRWTAPSAGGSTITNYTATASPGNAQVRVPGSTTSATMNGLDSRETYTFTIVASNAAGDSIASEPSNAVRPLSAPEALRRIADGYMTGSIDALLSAKATAPAPFNWNDDSCGGPVAPEGTFNSACLRHDFGYRNYVAG
jgi:hypothetical protein